jgi:hypothetical protein
MPPIKFAVQLIHFFTAGADEVRAWSLKEGKTAPEAAGRIHSDIEKNFVCAEVQVRGRGLAHVCPWALFCLPSPFGSVAVRRYVMCACVMVMA